MECGELTALRPLAEVAYGAVADSGPPMVIGGRTSDTALFVIHGPHILDEMKLFVPQCPQRTQPRGPPCRHIVSCVTIPLGLPQKNGSMIFALASSCQPPTMITSVARRAAQSSFLLRWVLLRTSAAMAASSAEARSPIG